MDHRTYQFRSDMGLTAKKLNEPMPADMAMAKIGAVAHASLRARALQMAHEYGGHPNDVVERAEAYLKFLSPVQVPPPASPDVTVFQTDAGTFVTTGGDAA